MVDAPTGTPGEAVAQASNFVHMLGARPLFADMLESDGLAASAHLLPQLMAASLLDATVDQPGWQEGRKIASRAFALGTAGMAYEDEAESLGMAVMQNRETILHKLNLVITSLFDLRDEIESGNGTAVTERMKKARASRKRWLNERAAADWLRVPTGPIEVQSVSERFLGTLFSKPKKKE
jgi:prephenate dehydrogenase